MQCPRCETYFTRYTCGKNVGSGECDCPKCQGYCQCEDLKNICGADYGDHEWVTEYGTPPYEPREITACVKCGEVYE